MIPPKPLPVNADAEIQKPKDAAQSSITAPMIPTKQNLENADAEIQKSRDAVFLSMTPTVMALKTATIHVRPIPIPHSCQKTAK